jgi:hypothetical protein
MWRVDQTSSLILGEGSGYTKLVIPACHMLQFLTNCCDIVVYCRVYFKIVSLSKTLQDFRTLSSI